MHLKYLMNVELLVWTKTRFKTFYFRVNLEVGTIITQFPDHLIHSSRDGDSPLALTWRNTRGRDTKTYTSLKGYHEL
jgi:hypothetical protein